MKECLGYNEFLKFAMDFHLSSNVILSTLEIGDIYLSSIKATEGQGNSASSRSQNSGGLVRCALMRTRKFPMPPAIRYVFPLLPLDLF